MEMKTREEKIELLQKSLVEQGWKIQDSMDNISMRTTDLRRDIQLALMEIKEKMMIYLAIVLFAMVILVKALAFALRRPSSSQPVRLNPPPTPA
jgi:hypothetical protein